MPIFSIHHACRLLCLVLALSLLNACGFELRGKSDIAFNNLFIQGPALSISKDLKKLLKVNGVTVVNNAEKADLLLELMSEENEQRILSLSGEGLVREYELFYRIHFRLREPASATWGPVQTIENRRDFTYDDAQLLAKQFEQERLYQDMRADAVRELMRRLAVQKPRPASPQTDAPAAG